MDLHRVASRVALLFDEMYDLQAEVYVDPNSDINNIEFYIEATKPDGTFHTFRIKFPGKLGDTPEIVQEGQDDKVDENSRVFRDIKKKVRNSEAYKHMVDALANPDKRQQDLLNSGDEVQVGDYLSPTWRMKVI